MLNCGQDIRGVLYTVAITLGIVVITIAAALLLVLVDGVIGDQKFIVVFGAVLLFVFLAFCWYLIWWFGRQTTRRGINSSNRATAHQDFQSPP